MSILIAIIVGIAVLGILILVHEAGHFFAAKLFGVKVEEFGFGFPIPGRIWSTKRGETVYSLNWLPAGGFVRLLGEEGESVANPRSFAAKAWYKRALIVAAGVIVNLCVGVILFTIIVASSGFKADFPLLFANKFPFGSSSSYTYIAGVDSGSPAEKAGIKTGDKIIKVDGKSFTSIEAFQSFVNSHKGQEITLELVNIRDNSQKEINLVPRVNPPAGEGAMGVGLGEGVTISYNTPLERTFVGVLHSANLLEFQWTGIKTLFTRSVVERSVAPITNNASGPVGIVAVISVVLSIGGIQSLIILANLVGLISLILGIANVLPIPAMDGGRLFFILLEGVRGKKVSPAIENRIHYVGLIVLLFLFVLITFNDFFKIFTGRIFG